MRGLPRSGRYEVSLTNYKAIFHPNHLRRTGSVALIVGTWLTAINQGNVFWTGELDPGFGSGWRLIT